MRLIRTLVLCFVAILLPISPPMLTGTALAHVGSTGTTTAPSAAVGIGTWSTGAQNPKTDGNDVACITLEHPGNASVGTVTVNSVALKPSEYAAQIKGNTVKILFANSLKATDVVVIKGFGGDTGVKVKEVKWETAQ